MSTKSSHIDRRDFLKSSAILGGGLALGAYGGSEALAAAKELRILFPGGTWQEFYQKTFVDPWVAEHGTEFIWKNGLGFEPLVIAQRRRPQWDLTHQNQNTSSQLGALDAIIEWKDEDLSNLADIHPAFRYPYLAGKVHTPYGLVVNTKRITKPVTKWSDMWDPEFKGKVGFPAWVWMGQEVFHAINQINGGTPDNVDPGIAKLTELYQDNDAVTIDNVEHTKQLLLSEEVWIAPFFSARADQARAAGAPVEFVIPEEGGLSFIFNTSIISGRSDESRQGALDFVNTTLDPEKQIEFSKLTGYPPTNVKAMKNLPAELKHLEMSDDQVASFGTIQRDFDYMAMFAYRDQIADRWNKEVLGG